MTTTTEFSKDFDPNHFQELDDHEILMTFFMDFDQNSGYQYPIIQLTMRFLTDLIRILQKYMTTEFL